MQEVDLGGLRPQRQRQLRQVGRTKYVYPIGARESAAAFPMFRANFPSARGASVNLAEKLVMRPIGALVPYASNSRTHTPDQISKIARSIKSFGFTIRSSSTARTAL
jgi:hypothetical protein